MNNVTAAIVVAAIAALVSTPTTLLAWFAINHVRVV